eukprot:m.137713 g.137713  ORF g.137713 m.137713 type:complete len:735 (-) comp29939_c0_seq1:248-2452(-)
MQAPEEADRPVVWKEHMFIVHDVSAAKKEEDPPENAIVVFLSPVEVEIRTQVYLTGGLVAMSNFASSVTGGPPRVFQLGNEKIATKIFGTYSLYLSGNDSEPDDLISAQLDTLYKAFCFYHGSIDAVFQSCNWDRKRFSSTMTRIWTSLVSYFRPSRDALHSGFRPIPSLGLPRYENRHYAMASQLLEQIQQRPGILGGCVLYRQRCMYTQLTPELTAYALALLQPTQSTTYTEEDNRRIQRRGLKIREMMLRGKSKLIRNREYRLRVYQNCFLGHEMVDLLIEKGEVRTRDAAKQLGRRLMQAGIIHHVMNEQDFRDEVRLYRFKVDEPESQRSDYSQGNSMASLVSRVQNVYNSDRSDSGSDRTSEYGTGYREAPAVRVPNVDLRPLVLAGHGRDARTTAALHGLSLPAGVHVLPVFLSKVQLDPLSEMATALQGFPIGLEQIIQLDLDEIELPHDKNDFDHFLQRYALVPYQKWLATVGWTRIDKITRALQKSQETDLGKFVAQFKGDKAEKEELLSVLLTAKTDMKEHLSRRKQPIPEKKSQLELYLQGLGSTVLVAMVTPESTKNQESVNELAEIISTGLASLEQSLCTHNETLGGLESQRTVESYNHIAFNNDSHEISGWCNTDRSMPESKLLPDTDEDKAFVDAVSDMHAFFQDPTLPDVAEIMVRKNYRTPTYGRTAFGQEAYIQLRQPTVAESQLRDESKPFDDDWAMMPEVAKSRLRNHHIHTL